MSTTRRNTESPFDQLDANGNPLYMYMDKLVFSNTGLVNIYPVLNTSMTSEQLYALTMSQIEAIIQRGAPSI